MNQQNAGNHQYWYGKIEHYLKDDPDFLEIYKSFTEAPWRSGHLDAKTKELLNIALSASPTHLNMATTQAHIRKALNLGATKEEIAEVLKIVSILGVHTCAVGIPLMMEHYRSDEALDDSDYTEEQRALKQKFIDTMGYWNQFRDDLIRMDTKYFDSYYEFLTIPTRRKILEPKVIEFIYIAIDSSTTHLFKKGIEVHLKNAIKYGATQTELLEVFQLTSAIGFHTLFETLPILENEVAKQKNLKG